MPHYTLGNFKYSYTIFDDISGNKALAEDEMDFKEKWVICLRYEK